ncbi:uncharacterized protein Hen1 isoform X2 [Plodia interpunctella]|uniref:uncharacterized protein Hen1 isoform X2 n=1 Tax=Plodia interpunctella TaxID=58824 RepID=UPI00236808B1|nr:uncharacterized protein LOC128669667 isoform X2 [Plodia interpunctella]
MIIAIQTLIFFRESLLAVLDGLFRPYYKRFLTFSRQSVSDDEESEDQVFSEFDDEKGVVFYPPMYAQRYAAVTDCLMDERWCGQLEKVVDLGYHDVSFIKYLKEIPGVKRILGVDLESIPLRCSSDLVIEYTPKRENPLQVTLFQGNAADPDYRLIGSDAVVAIEMIEHMLPHDLDRLIHTVFGFVKPWVAVFTTPNGDFNPLFKALEANGLRRLDHFFEWSREQFHDWCSNIVLRYPQYTVVCKGVGPGPPGTIHYGCCSQLALFISKDYNKQQDLDLNSLALVANTKDNNDLTDLIGSIESGSDDTERHMLCLPSNNMDSYLDLLSQSVSTLMATALTIVKPLEYTDQTSQCNIDDEIGKNFLMFEDESSLCVMIPRKKIVNRVYDIEDVANRLNCSTLQVKRFSKTTQNLMAKNKIDSLVHTREVVDEIRHLTKMLNFREATSDRGDGMWCNINWGDNAPYWNQYYKLVREYSYPFETKSEEGRIIDLISEEINRLIDSQYDDDFTVDMHKMEIPLQYLMKVVEHITTDVERVQDILEWNGYEIVNGVVIYSRLVVEENASTTTKDECWQDDSLSDDFESSEVRTTTPSDGSTIAPEFTGRCLQRALDRKVRKLRSMLTADEDIASELDRVVCRLMKLALRTSRTRKNPPPTKWMQCKLFDLLSLTEKAIDRRRKRFIENFPLNALEYDDKAGETMTVTKLKNDDLSVNMLVDKYQNLVQSYESKENQKVRNLSNFGGFDFDEDLSDSSNEFTKEFKCVDVIGPSNSAVFIEPVPKVTYERDYYPKGIEESKLQRIQAWVDDDIEVVPYPNHDVRLISSGDTDQSATNMTRHKFKKMSRKRKLTLISFPDKQDSKIRKKTLQQKSSPENNTNIQENNKTSKSKLKKAASKKSSYCLLVKANLYKTTSNSFGKLRSKKVKECVCPSTVNPIPAAFKDLCHPDLNAEKKLKENMKYLTDVDRLNDCETVENTTNVSATEESLLVDIVMDGLEETIALRRTIGTDAEDEPTEFEQETVMGSLLNVMRNDSFCNNAEIETENVHSQTIFLNDINEPSTSKGVRHVSMDVQCGPDVSTPPAFSTLSTTTSFTRLPKMFATGIKIGDSEMEVQSKLNCDFGTYTGDNDCHCKTITPRTKSVGIKIKDSDTNIKTKVEGFTMTQTDEYHHDVGSKETEMIKAISSGLKMEDSGSEYIGSVDGSSRKSPMIFESSPGFASDVMLKSSTSKEAGLCPKYTCMKYVPPKLSLGGVYVHSFKDKQTSEDILYQGEWQCCRPKALTKKRVVFSTSSVKKLSEMTKKLRVSSKEKLQDTKIEKGIMKLEQKNLKSVQVRTPARNFTKVKEKIAIKMNSVTNNASKNIKFNRNVTKTSSKGAISSLTNKPKASNVLKRPAMLSSRVTRKEPETKSIIKPPETKTLKRVLNPNAKSILNKSFDSTKVPRKTAKDKPIGHVLPLGRSKTEFIKKELLKFDDSPRDNISYVVLRNGSENKNNNKSNVSPKTNSFRKSDNGATNRRSLSPQSPTSSTCSSRNSIATVRLVTNRPRTASRNPDSETPVRNKKFTKKNRIIKKADIDDLDDKENIPESSNGAKKETEGKAKNAFVTTQKNVYRAQVKTENLKNNLSNRPKTSTPKKTNLKSSAEATTRPSRSSLVNKSPSFSSPERVRSSYRASSPQQSITMFSWSTQLAEVERNRSHSLPREVNSSDRNIAMSLKKMIEDRLDFIGNSSGNVSSIGSKTCTFSYEHLNSQFDESSTAGSYKTIINNEDLNNTLALQNDLVSAVNRTFDSVADSRANDDNEVSTDADVLSFKTTTAASRASEYFLADNDLDTFQGCFSKENSVRDIFERKNPLDIQSNGSILASQAFSGFSISAVAGDQPDPINFMDSETGSLVVDTGRQAASEEVFVSGRSSGSYESCLYDDEALLPYWLFHINNQFVDEEEEQEPGPPIPMELPEAVFDMNGNVVAAGAGAGDGRGMHSDHSQDSSGHGTTSTTSSDPSSGVQSEAILIDPSVFTGQYDLPAAAVAVEIPDVPLHEGEHIGEEAGADRNGRRNPVLQLLATSDMDADVSSLDTDVQDSS